MLKQLKVRRTRNLPRLIHVVAVLDDGSLAGLSLEFLHKVVAYECEQNCRDHHVEAHEHNAEVLCFGVDAAIANEIGKRQGISRQASEETDDTGIREDMKEKEGHERKGK